MRDLIAKINKRLPHFEQLHKSRPYEINDFGEYYIKDHSNNSIVAQYVEIKMVAEELGIEVK